MRFVIIIWICGLSANAADWPTYMGDDARSGVSLEQLKLPLERSWIHQPLHAPRPAWRGPAKRDLYNKVGVLKNRQLFDHVFHVIADAKHVYFGSSADDQVHCLNAVTGKEKWTYFTEGPVRFAPTLHGGKLFVGSDDGHAYCLSTEGKLIWRKLLAPRDYRIAGNNRIISAWPLRTGILIRDGIAYAGAGMFPKEKVHLVAFDSVNGKVERWRTEQGKWPAQGYLLLSESRVYVPTGRSNPIVYDRNTGDFIQYLSGNSDRFTLIKWEKDKPVNMPNPRQKGRILGLIPDKSKDSFATFTGNHMIVHGGKSYLHVSNELHVLDRVRYLTLEPNYKDVADAREKLGKQLSQLRKQKSPKAANVQEQLIAATRDLDKIRNDIKSCVLWRVQCNQSHSLILSGDTLFAGAKNEIVAYAASDGKRVWSAPVNGAAMGIAVAHGRLLVSTDKGTIYCFGAK